MLSKSPNLTISVPVDDLVLPRAGYPQAIHRPPADYKIRHEFFKFKDGHRDQNISPFGVLKIYFQTFLTIMHKYCSYPGMDYKAFFMSVNKNFQTWLLIGWQLYCQSEARLLIDNTATSQSEAILQNLFNY